MNIAISTRFLIANKLEGIGRYALETTRRIVAAHPEHTFYFFFDRPFSSDFLFAPNIIPVVLQPPARHPFLYVLWYEWAVARALRQYECNVFYSPDGFLSLDRKSVV